jgi:hypothetical protein
MDAIWRVRILITSLLITLPLFCTAMFLAVGVKFIDRDDVRALFEKLPLTIGWGCGSGSYCSQFWIN